MTGETGEWHSVGTGLQVDIDTGVGQAMAVGHSLLSYSVSDDIITNTEVLWLALCVCLCVCVCVGGGGSCGMWVMFVGFRCVCAGQMCMYVWVRCVCVGQMCLCGSGVSV